MKKFVSCFLIIVFIVSLPVFSFSDWDSAEFNWSSVENIVNQTFPGEINFYSIPEVDVSFWLPSSFASVELSSQDIQSNCIGSFITGPEDSFVSFYYTDSNGLTLDNLYNSMLAMNRTVKKISVNNIPAILQRDDDNGILFLVFQTFEGKFFEVAFFPDYAEVLFDLVIASIRPNVEEVSNTEPVISVNPVSGLISK